MAVQAKSLNGSPSFKEIFSMLIGYVPMGISIYMFFTQENDSFIMMDYWFWIFFIFLMSLFVSIFAVEAFAIAVSHNKVVLEYFFILLLTALRCVYYYFLCNVMMFVLFIDVLFLVVFMKISDYLGKNNKIKPVYKHVVYCKKCGYQHDGTDLYCPNCGLGKSEQ